jgi:Uncharacterized protein conserved in bacteria
MRKFLYVAALLLAAAFQTSAQNTIRVEAPDVVAADEQFNVTFIIEGEKSPSGFSWNQGDDFQLVWGPQRGTSTSVQIINGKRTSSHQSTYTYILLPKSTGTFTLPAATATMKGETISSNPRSIQVVSDGASSRQSSQSSGQSQASSGSSSASSSKAAVTGEIPSDDLFLRLSVSKSQAVLGEPVIAVLKLYQRVNIAGFENAKFPSFNGFWSQETFAPSNIEFKRESFDDKIYNTAVLRSYVLIPQQSGTITIDPAELVCLVNVRAAAQTSNSIFDSFFQDEYRTIRKRVATPAVHVKVSPLPAGQPASFGGGVGSFGISARLTADDIKTHDAASLIITISGRGNVALLEEPKVSFPPDFEVYDTKSTENTDKSNGGTSGSKSFEFPFIPRSAGDFTIEPIEYSYYDVSTGKYVTLHTPALPIKVAKGKGGEASHPLVQSGVERSDVRSLSDDIRYISTKKPSFTKGGSFFVGSALFWMLSALLVLGAAALSLAFRKVAAMRADVAGTKNRKASKMALRRLKQAGDYLDKNLYTAFYEELHKALIGFVSDKLNMDMSEMSKENLASALVSGGVSESGAKDFTDLLDACEFARYSPDSKDDAMRTHYEKAVEVVTMIDSSMKSGKNKNGRAAAGMIAVMLGLGVGFSAYAQTDSTTLGLAPAPAEGESGVSEDASSKTPEVLWSEGVAAYGDGRFSDAEAAWSAIVASGEGSPELYYNLGNAFFKEGNYPKAVLNYERALKMDPSYSEARYNLEFTNGFVQDKIELVPEFLVKSLARKVCYLMSSDTWAVIFIVLLAVALAAVLLFLLGPTAGKRRLGFFTAVVLFVLALCSVGFSFWQKSDFKKADTAIVMAPVSSVKSSPSGASSKDLFIVHEGTKVKILDSVEGWDNVSLADGRQGWIKSKDIEVI